jgi:uncharacterized membrane protein
MQNLCLILRCLSYDFAVWSRINEVKRLIVAFIFYIIATSHLRRTFDTFAKKSGEASFTTAGNLLWWGPILSIILVGLVLILIAWIFATIGFFAMKPQQL